MNCFNHHSRPAIGGAIGYYAAGGGAFGYYAAGGGYVITESVKNPEAVEFFGHWLPFPIK